MTDPHSPGGPIKSEFADDPEMMELVRSFIDDLPRHIGDLESAWRAADIEIVRHIAHQLKGACGGYGFAALGAAAADLEQAVKATDHDLSCVQRELDQLLDLCNRASL